jgi:hypothetical protein
VELDTASNNKQPKALGPILLLLGFFAFVIVRHSMVIGNGVYTLAIFNERTRATKGGSVLSYQFQFHGTKYYAKFTTFGMCDSVVFCKFLLSNPSQCFIVTDYRVPKCLLQYKNSAIVWDSIPDCAFNNK